MSTKEEIKIGSILICRGNSWISKAIMTVLRDKWSHAAIYATVWDTKGIIEAQAPGVSFKLWATWVTKWGYKYVIFEPTFEYDEKEIMLKAFSKSGETPYDFFTFFRRVLGNRKKRTSAKEEEKQICSEFCAWVWDIPEWHDMTPQELHDILLGSDRWKLRK